MGSIGRYGPFALSCISTAYPFTTFVRTRSQPQQYNLVEGLDPPIYVYPC